MQKKWVMGIKIAERLVFIFLLLMVFSSCLSESDPSRKGKQVFTIDVDRNDQVSVFDLF